MLLECNVCVLMNDSAVMLYRGDWSSLVALRGPQKWSG